MNYLICGVDVSQHQLDVAYRTETEATFLGTFENSPSGIEALGRALRTHQRKIGAQTVWLIVEPTGGYEQRLVRFALQAGWRVSLPNPYQVRQWAKGCGIRAKTDPHDAILLTRYGAAQKPPTFTPPSEEIELLENLLARLTNLETMLRQEKNRQQAAQKKPTRSAASEASLEQSIAFLEQQIEGMKQAIAEHVASHPTLLERKKQLLSVPGVGQKNVCFLLVLLSRFAQMTDGNGTSKSLTAYVGLDPVPYQSGTSVYKRPRISRQGSGQMRHYLFLGALGGVRGNNPLRDFYHRLVGRGKAKKVALIAAARKILVWSWAIFQQQTYFDAARLSTDA